MIDRCLDTLLAEAHDEEFEVVVSCNACTDDTALRAAAHPGVRAIEIATPSKMAALQAADDATKQFPRIYLDADVLLTTFAARQLVGCLRTPGIEAAAPRPRFDTSSRRWTVRAYFDVMQRLPVFGEGYVGSGLYALSETGRTRFDQWPEGYPDDGLVQRLIRPERRATVDSDFIITTPGSLRHQVRRFARVQRLNRKLEQSSEFPLRGGTAGSTLRSLVSQMKSPRKWPGVGLFLLVSLAARTRATIDERRGAVADWKRDDSTRQPRSGVRQ